MAATYRRPPPARASVRPKKIGSVNWVSVSLVLVLAALIYAGWKFFPPWYGQFDVRGEMLEVAMKAGRTPDPEVLDADLRARLAALGVAPLEDPAWTFGAEAVTVKLRYRVSVVHPVVLKPTVLTFEEEATAARGAGVP